MISTTGILNPYISVRGLATTNVNTLPERHGATIFTANVSNDGHTMAVFYGELENEEDIDLGDL